MVCVCVCVCVALCISGHDSDTLQKSRILTSYQYNLHWPSATLSGHIPSKHGICLQHHVVVDRVKSTAHYEHEEEAQRR